MVAFERMGRTFGSTIDASHYISQTVYAQKLVDETHKAYVESEGCPDVRLAHEYGSGSDGAHTTGREKLEDLFRVFAFINENIFELSERQTAIIVDNYLAASLQQVFGQEIISQINYLLQKFKLDELFEEVIVMMRRRGGKTVATAAFVAAVLSVLFAGNTNVYGKSKRVSVMMKDLVEDIVVALTKSGQFGIVRIKDNNEETLSVVTKYNTLNIGKFYPCNEDVHVPFFLLCVFLWVLGVCMLLVTSLSLPRHQYDTREREDASPRCVLPFIETSVF